MVYTLKKRKPPIDTGKKYPRLAKVVWKDKVYEDFTICDARFAVELAESGSQVIFNDGDNTL